MCKEIYWVKDLFVFISKWIECMCVVWIDEIFGKGEGICYCV